MGPGPGSLLALSGIVNRRGYPVLLGCCGASPTSKGTACAVVMLGSWLLLS